MLSEKEKEHQKNLNRKNGYGLNRKMLARLGKEHKKAYSVGDTKTMEKIEYRLTDINFHSECAMLTTHDYTEFKENLKHF